MSAGAALSTPPPTGSGALALIKGPRPPQALVWASVVELAIEYAFDLGRHPILDGATQVLAAAVAAATALEIVVRAARAPRRFVAERWGDLLALGAIVFFAATAGLRVAGAAGAARNLWRVARDVASHGLLARVAARLVARPLQLLIASFALVIATGTATLMARAATADGEGASLLTALFTATSATCVTGLVVVDTATYFSRFGQWVVLGLVQIGGLGIMTITSALAIAFQRRLSARMRGAMQEILDEATLSGFRRIVAGSVLLTLAFEAIGAVALYPAMAMGNRGEPLAGTERLFFAAFHAVSAFCNAGFSLYSNSLTPFAGAVSVNLTVAALVVAGGIGFPVLVELLRPSAWRHGPRGLWRALSAHARLVLQVSGILIAGGALAFLALEWQGALAALPAAQRPLAALFQSISFRTAGFNTVDFGSVQPATLALGVALMFVGGSPSSTAGGIKTTTTAVLLLALRAMVRGRDDVEVHGRALTRTNVYRAVAVASVSALILFSALVLLLVAERAQPFGGVLFEAASAFGTVGLSTGITPSLGAAGKLVVIALMFAGRIGPFSIALAVGEAEKGHYEFPQGKVLVG